MKNPSDSAQLHTLLSTKIIISIVSIICAVIYLIPYAVIPQFAETFSAFGADLPLMTISVLKLHFIFPILAAGSGFSFLIWLDIFNYKQQRRIFLLSIANLTVAFIICVLSIVSLYLPIFDSSTVI